MVFVLTEVFQSGTGKETTIITPTINGNYSGRGEWMRSGCTASPLEMVLDKISRNEN